MDIMTFVSSLVKDIVWPIFVFILVLLFKSDLSSLFKRISKFTWDKATIVFDTAKDRFAPLSKPMMPGLAAAASVVTKLTQEQMDKSKLEAQLRLDEDTVNIGYQRGQLFQHEDGSWGIQWPIVLGARVGVKAGSR